MDYSEKTREDLIREIISLKKSNDELRECCESTGSRLSLSEEMFRKAFTTNPDSININRLSDGMFMSINDGFTKILGYTREDVNGRTSLDLNVWYNAADREYVVSKLLEKGSIENFEAKFIGKGGKVVDGLMSAAKIDIGSIPHILSITKDITQRKQIEEEFRKEQFLFKALMDNLKDAVYFKDKESRFIRINKMHIEKFNISDPLEAIGKTDFDFFTEEHAKTSFMDEQEILTTGKTLIKEEKETQPGKSDKWVSTVKMPMNDSAGNIIGTFGISRDITNRKRTDLEKEVINSIIRGVTATSDFDEFLRLVHNSLSKIISSENIFIALYDYETCQFTFPYFVDKYDKIPAPSSMKNSCTSYIFRTGKELVFTVEVFEKLIKENEVEEVGSPSPSWVGIPLKTPSKTIGVMVLQDYERENVYTDQDVEFLVSVGSQIAVAIERWQAEAAIRLKNNQLQISNAEKDKFFSIIAHDLRGPLGSFVEATKLITDHSQMISMEEVMDLTDIMKKEASSIYGLLENLLEWSRLKRGVLDFNPVKLNIKEKVSSVIELLSKIASRKNILVENIVPDDYGIEADINMFETIIRNLLSNAIKFTSSGGKISISAKQSGDSLLEISVCDNGIGMDENLKQKLFMLREKTNRPGTEGEPSSGLGLHLCREFVEKHGGEMHIESEPGIGSCFSFTMKKV